MSESRYYKPLSPHLSIYKPQISTTLSILHRITGAALFVGALLLVWWVVDQTYSTFRPVCAWWDVFYTVYGKVMLVGWSFAWFYHMLNGVRHLFWDAGYGFSLPVMARSGWAVVIGSLLLTAASWTYVLGGFAG